MLVDIIGIVVVVVGVPEDVDVEEEERLFAFKDYVVEGNYNDLNDIPNSIILGKIAAEKMSANIGDLVQVTTTKTKEGPQ